MADRNGFPADPIDRHRVVILYDIPGSYFDREIGPLLRAWRVGRACYYSERELRKVLATLAHFEPARVQGSENTTA